MYHVPYVILSLIDCSTWVQLHSLPQPDFGYLLVAYYTLLSLSIMAFSHSQVSLPVWEPEEKITVFSLIKKKQGYRIKWNLGMRLFSSYLCPELLYGFSYYPFRCLYTLVFQCSEFNCVHSSVTQAHCKQAFKTTRGQQVFEECNPTQCPGDCVLSLLLWLLLRYLDRNYALVCITRVLR